MIFLEDYTLIGKIPDSDKDYFALIQPHKLSGRCRGQKIKLTQNLRRMTLEQADPDYPACIEKSSYQE